MSQFNFTGPYEPYRDYPSRSRSIGSNEHNHLVGNDYGVAHGRSTSPDSRGSIEGRHPTKPAYGMAY